MSMRVIDIFRNFLNEKTLKVDYLPIQLPLWEVCR